MKNPLKPAGIEPATFRFVAQHINHCATAVPKSNPQPPVILFKDQFIFLLYLYYVTSFFSLILMQSPSFPSESYAPSVQFSSDHNSNILWSVFLKVIAVLIM